MTTLPRSSTLSKVVVVVAVVALALYAVGALTMKWLTQTFNTPALPPLQPALEVTADFGLYKYCSDRKVIGTDQTSHGCSSDGAEDWQKISAGTAVVGAVASFAGLVLAVLNVTVSKVAARKIFKFVVALLMVAAVICLCVTLALYAQNKDGIQVAPPLPLFIDFDLGWSYYVCAVSAAFHGLVALLSLLDYCSCCSEDSMVDAQWSARNQEVAVSYTNNAMS